MNLDVRDLPNIDRNATYKIGSKGIAIKLTFRCEKNFPYTFVNKGRYYYSRCILVVWQDNMLQAIYDGYYLLKNTILKEITSYHIAKLEQKSFSLDSYITAPRDTQYTFDF